MRNRIEIENIAEMRSQLGIDDVELAEAIRELNVGDVVNLTFLTPTRNFAIARVRITHMEGVAFRGKVVQSASCVRPGKVVEFTIAHIHSVVAAPAKPTSSSSLR